MIDEPETSGLPAPRDRRARSGRRELDHPEEYDPVEVEPTPARKEGGDLSPFFDYLKTDKGHEISTRLLAILEDVKKAALTHGSNQTKWELWFRGMVVVAVVAAAVVLAAIDKFSTPVGVLFGALIGYILKKGP